MLTPVKTKNLYLIVITALLFQGCGFQLRGISNLPAFISPVYIQGLAQNHPLQVELVQLLESSATATTADGEAAASTLQISNYSSDRRVLSVDGSGKVAEYELREGVQFQLVNATGTELVAAQPVSVIQSYINTEDEVLGKQQEEGILRTAMRRDLAGQIMRRLQSQLK